MKKMGFFFLWTILIPFLQSFDSNNTAVIEENKNKINMWWTMAKTYRAQTTCMNTP